MYKKQLLSVPVACLLVLSGCQTDKNEKNVPVSPASETYVPTSKPSAPVGEVLLTIDGKPKLTVDDFDRYKDQFFAIQPQYKQILQFMPAAEQVRIDQNIFQNMVTEALFQEWVAKSGIDKRKDYQDDLNMIMDMGKRNLAIKYYQEENPVKITDDEVKKFYEDNKDKMPELMESQGGVNAQAVKFETEAAAKDFLAKVKGGDIETAAKEAGLTVEDLKEVNQMSFNVDTPLRQKLLDLKTFPSDFYVKVNDTTFYVVHATGKDKPEYVPFEQVKMGLENYLKQQKMGDMITKGAEELKKKYNVNENMKYFTQKMVEAEKAAQEKQAKQPQLPQDEEDTMDEDEHHSSSVKGA